MHWLSFFVGALIAWLIGWLIEMLINRPRQRAAEADLRLKLENAQKESASLKAQVAGQGRMPAHLYEAGSVEGGLQSGAAKQGELEASLASAKAEADSLRAQLAGKQDLQVRLDQSQAELEAQKAKLAATVDLRGKLDTSEAEANRYRLEVERLQSDLAAARLPGAGQVAGLGASLSAQAQAPEAGSMPAHLYEGVGLAGGLQAGVGKQADLEASLASAKAEADSLRAQLAGMQDLQVRLDQSQGEIEAQKAQLAATADLRGKLDTSEAEANRYRLEVERLQSDLAAARLPGAGQGAALGVNLSATGLPEVGAGAAAFAAPLAAEPDLRFGLADARPEPVTWQAQVPGLGSVPAPLYEVGSAAGGLQAAGTGMQADLDSNLASAKAEAESLRAQLAGTQDLQARLDQAQGELEAQKARLADLDGLRADLDTSEAEANRYRLEVQRLQSDLAAARLLGAGQVAGLGAGLTAMGRPETGAGVAVFAAPLGIAAVTPPVVEAPEPDDLVIIEGIGPKITELLIKNGIRTFSQLAGASVERLNSILDSGGPSFRAANPETWAEQAQLARDGKWDLLTELQGALRGGRKV